jgi:hypothetical protein
VTESEINSAWLPYGTLRVNESLGSCFTTPFSSNNETARDLSIHYAYLGILLRTRNQDDSEELKNDLILRVTDICCGNAPMILDDGTSFFAATGSKFDAYSTTQDYKPTFDMREAEQQRIDPDLIDDLWGEDI